MHWAAEYIGLPYAPAGRGPEAVDCWGLICKAYQEQWGIILPEMPGMTITDFHAIKELQNDWIEKDFPIDGYLVAMSQQKTIHHVGLYIVSNGGRVVHCYKSQNVIVDTMRNLKLKGFRVIKFYQHKDFPV